MCLVRTQREGLRKLTRNTVGEAFREAPGMHTVNDRKKLVTEHEMFMLQSFVVSRKPNAISSLFFLIGYV